MSNVTLHHTNDVNAGTATCGITTVNVTTHHDKVTCKRCLARLAKAAETRLQDAAELVDEPTESVLPATHAVNPTNPRYTVCGTPKADVTIALSLDDVTCPRCLTKLAPSITEPIESYDIPVTDTNTMKDVHAARDRVRAALKSAKATIKEGRAIAKAPRAPKAPKAPTVHLHDAERSTHQTWCKIPGVTTTDASAVTCKVCRAHIDGKAPVNAVPERVKAARKAFRSFVARATYMAFMDEGCLGTSWHLTHTNMAGERYTITATGDENGLYLCNDHMAGDSKQSLTDTIEQLGWSCGEEK